MSLIILKISGMTCINCKTRIENALAVLEGIKKADVSWKKRRADIEYDEEKISLNEIQKIIESLDYKVENSGDGKGKKSLSRVLINITYLIIIAFLFLILQKTGLLNYLAPAQTADSKMSYGLLFLTGLFNRLFKWLYALRPPSGHVDCCPCERQPYFRDSFYVLFQFRNTSPYAGIFFYYIYYW